MSLDKGHLTLVLENPNEAASSHKSLQWNVAEHQRRKRRWKFSRPSQRETISYCPVEAGLPLSTRKLHLEATDHPTQRICLSMICVVKGSLSFLNTYRTPPHLTVRSRTFTFFSRFSFRRWGPVKYNMPFFKSKSWSEVHSYFVKLQLIFL